MFEWHSIHISFSIPEIYETNLNLQGLFDEFKKLCMYIYFSYSKCIILYLLFTYSITIHTKFIQYN